jgi:hypothetical protein
MQVCRPRAYSQLGACPSDHIVQVLDYASGDLFVAAEFDALGTGRAPVDESGEQQPVEPDCGRRVLSAQIVDHPTATIDNDAKPALQRTGQLENDPGSVRRVAELAASKRVERRRPQTVSGNPSSSRPMASPAAKSPESAAGLSSWVIWPVTRRS